MRGFLQISPTSTDYMIATRHLVFEHINTFHLLNLWATEVKEQTRNCAIVKRLTWYFSSFSQLNERFSSNISHQHEQIKGIYPPWKNECLSAIFSCMMVGDIWRNQLIELTKWAKISWKAFSYGAIPDLFLDLRSSKMEQMKGIDALKK